MYPVSCIRHGQEGETLKVEINIQCLINQIIAQAKVPIKGSKYHVENDTLVIEVVPDVESILSTVLSK